MFDIRKISAEETLSVRHAVLWPDKDVDYVRIANDDEGIHLGGYLEDELISVISVFVEGQEAQFRKFATLVEHQGKGYGSKLFEAMLREIQQLRVDRVWCNARLDANAFYRRYGFDTSAEAVFYKGDVGYTIMERKL